ncbi:MAG: hypothetical protein QOJ07_2273, partial [Thermoleophilaceae bacterium]|nr:hypothetical protein [Thermoleophilaceae bacterium]
MKLSLGATPLREHGHGTDNEGRTTRRFGTAARRAAVPRRVTRDVAELAELRALEPGVDVATASRDTMWRDLVFRRGLALSDLFGAAAALLVAQSLFGELELHTWMIALGVPLVVFASKAVGLYDRDELVIAKTTLGEAPALFQLATLYTLVVTLLTSEYAAGALRPAATVGLWALMWTGLMVARSLARLGARAATTPERCVLLGGRESADRLRAKFECHNTLHADLVAYLPFEKFELGRQRSKAFAHYIAERDIQRVIIGGSESHEEVADAVRYFKNYGLKVSVLPSLLEVVGSAVEFDDVHGTTLLGVRRFGLSRSSAALKRVLDVSVSALALLFLSPLLAAIAVAIRLDSRGPVLFRQTRVGRDGECFTMFKFRTMFTGSERRKAELAGQNATDGLFKLVEDPRVTRVGGFLRRSSLDELPQLLNVLRGVMSLVGPRPLVEDEDARVEGWHRRRLHLTPGMTGAWQIVGGTRGP